MDFREIDAKKRQLDSERPLPRHTVQSLREHLLLEWTYTSNAIEGNTLTLSETRVVLEGMTVGGKTMREHLEVINHRDAIMFVEELVQSGQNLTEWNIRNLHRLILKAIDDENAGMYRTENVLISGAKHRPPEHFLVKQQMDDLVMQLNEEWTRLHPIERAAMLHGEFVKVHPFVDGNGRTARLLMNFELMKAGYPAAIIEATSRPRYYDALDLAHTTGNYSPFIMLVAECADKSLDLWLSMAS